MYVNVADAGKLRILPYRAFASAASEWRGISQFRQSVMATCQLSTSLAKHEPSQRIKVFFAHLESGELITVFRIGSTCQLCRARIAEKKQRTSERTVMVTPGQASGHLIPMSSAGRSCCTYCAVQRRIFSSAPSHR